MPPSDTVNQFGNQVVSSAPCPLFSPQDYLQLLQLEHQAALGNQGAEAYLLALQLGQNRQPITAVGQPLDQTDQFSFTAFSASDAVPVSFYGRIQRPDGSIVPFNYILTTDAAGTLVTTTPRTGPGWLLGTAASIPAGTSLTGSVSAVAMIGRSVTGTFTPHTLLFSGQLDGFIPLTSVNPPPQTPLNRVSFLAFNDLVGGAVPYTKTITVPSGFRMRVTRVEFVYVCGAGAGTRFPTLSFLRDGASFQTNYSSLSRTAGQTGVYNNTVSGNAAVVSNISSQPLNDSLYFYDSVDLSVVDGASPPTGGDSLTSFRVRYEIS